MKIATENKTLKITLSKKCAIAKAETHAEKLRSSLSGDMEEVELDAQNVENMDTAYFQLLLSLKAASDKKGITFSVSGISPEVQNVFELYGLMFDA